MNLPRKVCNVVTCVQRTFCVVALWTVSVLCGVAGCVGSSPAACSSCAVQAQLCGISLFLPWPAQTPPPTAREMPTPRPVAAATTRRAMTILIHSLCLPVKFLNKVQPRARLYVFRWSMTAWRDGHMEHSLTRPSTDDLGCCVVAADSGRPASASRSNVCTSRCVLLWGALLASMERRASGCL
jgi:hypothetical protein